MESGLRASAPLKASIATNVWSWTMAASPAPIRRWNSRSWRTEYQATRMPTTSAATPTDTTTRRFMDELIPTPNDPVLGSRLWALGFGSWPLGRWAFRRGTSGARRGLILQEGPVLVGAT